MIHALTTTYCLCNGSFYEQKDVALGSPPPAPVVASLYTENSKQLGIKAAIKMPTHWFRYTTTSSFYGYTERRSYKIF